MRSLEIHAWIGVVGGLIFYICCFSGALALFERDLVAWERPATRFDTTGAALTVDDALEIAVERLGNPHSIYMTLPGAEHVGYHAQTTVDGVRQRIAIDPATGDSVGADDGAFAFLTHLHTDLHLPRPFGRYLVGLIGIVMIVSLISGVAAYPRILKDAFMIRWRSAFRVTISDLHKQLGLWGLLFGLVIAATGAVIGLLGLIAPVMVLSAYDGDVNAAFEAFSGPHQEESEEPAAMLEVAPLIERLEAERGLRVTSLYLEHWGTESAELSFNLSRAPYRSFLAGETHRLNLVDGTTIFVSAFTDRGIGNLLFGTVQPLHYGSFGGMTLKVLYFLLALALSFLIVSGSMIYLERRRLERRSPVMSRFGGVVLGVSLGQIIASAAAIAAGRLAPGAVEPLFWLTWLVSIALATFVGRRWLLIRGGLLVSALLLGGVGAYDLIGTGGHSMRNLQVDAFLLLLAVLLGFAAWKCPSDR